MKIVTGGAGFIGSNIVADLCLDNKQDIVVCDKFDTSLKWKNLLSKGLEDIIQPDQLIDFLEENSGQIETVIHMGAVSNTDITDSRLAVETNFKLSKKLWEWTAGREIPFFYASSAATYGNGENGFDDENDIRKYKNLRPLNLYGWSKHIFDLWVLKQIENSRPAPPRWAGLKFFNVYGQNEYHKGNMQSLIAKNYQKVTNGETINLFKSHKSSYRDGEQSRDFVYVNDCVSVVNWLMSGNRPSKIYNVGTGISRSFNDLIACLGKAAGIQPSIEYIDMPAQIQDSYQYFTQANIENLVKAGYDRPFTSLEDGVAEYVSSYLRTENPYR